MAMAAEVEVGAQSGSGDNPAVLRLRPFSEDRELWRELLGTSPDATLYHRDPWIELLSRAYSLSLRVATLHQGGTVRAGCVFTRGPLSGRLISLSFSDNCPPLAKEPEDVHRLMHALIEDESARRAYEVRGIGGVPNWETVECFVDWRLSLDRPLAQIERAMAVNFRRNLRRASREAITIERGTSVELLRRFYAMQLQSRRRLGLPPQPWRFFKLAREIFGAQGNFEVWTARDNGEDAASAVFLRDGDVIHYKWGARRTDDRSHANHLLFWNAIEEFSRTARILDLGRADVRNQGLMRFKAELGATAVALPSSFYPRAPSQVSAEVLTGARALLARIWRRMPMFATQLGGRMVYRFLG
jgi:hypothetical protein